MEDETLDTPEFPETLIDAQAVARWLGVSPSTVYEAAARGQLPTVRLWKGRRRTLMRFRRSDIELFIQQRSGRTS